MRWFFKNKEFMLKIFAELDQWHLFIISIIKRGRGTRFIFSKLTLYYGISYMYLTEHS